MDDEGIQKANLDLSESVYYDLNSFLKFGPTVTAMSLRRVGQDSSDLKQYSLVLVLSLNLLFDFKDAEIGENLENSMILMTQ